ncbi:armadillo-type protein [Lipomyces japonicus]|uniref:armadillo-type protein n=1 Tax=Lipomyces japonicus TaxID=56871 RepID=UPI0034CEAC0F
MEKLLKWSLENSKDSTGTGEIRQNSPDPKVLAQLFGQPDDAQLMRQALNLVADPNTDLEQKETALDNLEMLVENLDNANNLDNLGLWELLIEQLSNPEPVIRKMTCWVIGTAVQNNPKSQAALLVYPDAIPKLIDIAARDPSKECRLKAMYTLSSEIRNHNPGYESFNSANGWEALISIIRQEAENKVEASKANIKPDERHLYETDEDVRRRSIFLLAGILSTEPVESKVDILRSLSAVPNLLELLHIEGSEAAIDKLVQVFLVIANSSSGFTQEETEGILKGLERAKEEGLLSLETSENPELVAEWRQLEQILKQDK